MKPRRRTARLGLESLEGREVPANLTVTFSPLTHTLTVVGDADPNDVTVHAVVGSDTAFTLTSSGTINGRPGAYAGPAGVNNLAFRMLGGNDNVVLDNAVPVRLRGGLAIDGGDGVTLVQAIDLAVGGGISVTNGNHAAGTDFTYLTNLTVGRNVTVRSAGGDTETVLQRTSAGVSVIGGSLRVTNGAGRDTFELIDTDVGGGVTIDNGAGDPAGNAGLVSIHNQYNTTFRSVIGGNLAVTYRGGNTGDYDGIWDVEVRGDVTLNHGPGEFDTHIDGLATALPVIVRGNLSVTGTGTNSLSVGNSVRLTGLDVGRNFTLTGGGGAGAFVVFSRLQVGGDTAVTLGGGSDRVSIDDSTFAGRFALATGAGDDTVNLELARGTTAATAFDRAVRIDLGAGADTINVVSNSVNVPDDGEAVVALGPFVVTGWETASEAFDREFFPRGGGIQFL